MIEFQVCCGTGGQILTSPNAFLQTVFLHEVMRQSPACTVKQVKTKQKVVQASVPAPESAAEKKNATHLRGVFEWRPHGEIILPR